MEYRRTMSLVMPGGARQQVLVEAGSTVLVVAGALALRAPLQWLAGNMLVRAVMLGAEEIWVADTSGWVELVARGSTRAVIIPADSLSLWRQVGSCLQSLFATVQEAGVCKQSGGRT
ncbi:MAG: hypothetical protein HYU74_13815 [Dechloromonas sp.]|nr:hypothetical protein [Dechloromonas sp.]